MQKYSEVALNRSEVKRKRFQQKINLKSRTLTLQRKPRLGKIMSSLQANQSDLKSTNLCLEHRAKKLQIYFLLYQRLHHGLENYSYLLLCEITHSRAKTKSKPLSRKVHEWRK